MRSRIDLQMGPLDHVDLEAVLQDWRPFAR
jgi:hypothetical protein